MTLLTTSKNLFPSFPTFFDGDRMWNLYSPVTLPAVNILENEDSFTIEVAAPGMKKEDFEIKLDNGKLTVSSKYETKNEDVKYTKREFNFKAFERVFTVPVNVVDNEKVTAAYNDGILSIGLPKREELKPKPAKDIQIS